MTMDDLIEEALVDLQDMFPKLTKAIIKKKYFITRVHDKNQDEFRTIVDFQSEMPGADRGWEYVQYSKELNYMFSTMPYWCRCSEDD